ncbi:hypothetical protein CGC20_4885 [Leishmania donovani]|uniref:Uncharacterized protein n=2 Tax=Leishmania donovani TaxID=5661 RepID=A0A504Y0W9_LEIDO|nr:hypothetical protein CGC20_4885 [Leishmania donovani]
MVDSVYGGSAAAFPATASAGGAGAGATRFTSVAQLHAREAGASLSSLMDALSRLEVLFRASGEALCATTQSSAPDPRTENVARRDRDERAPSTEPKQTALQVPSTLDALATAAARCDAEVGQQLAVLRRGVSALAQELSALSERYPSMNAKGSWAGATGGAGSPSSPPAATLRTPQIMARGVGSDAAVPSSGLGASSAASSAARPAMPAASTRPVSAASPPLRAAASPSRTAPPAESTASPPLAFSLVDRPELQVPAAQLPHAACVENGMHGGRAWKREDSNDGGRGGGEASQLKSPDGQPTRSGLGGDSTHQRSETDEFLRRLTEESPYELSEEEQQQQRQLSGSAAADRRASSKAAITGSGKRHRSHGPVQTTPTRRTPRRRTRSTKANGADAQPQQASRRRGRPTLQESVDALVLGQLRADGIALPAPMEAELCWCEEDDVSAVSQGAEAASGVAAAARSAKPAAKGAKRLSDGSSGRGYSSATGDVEADFAVVLQEVRTLVQHGQRGSVCRGSLTTTSAGSAKELSTGVDNPRSELSRVSAQLSTRLPTTSTWLAQIHDFCALLEDMAIAAAAGDADATASAEEDRQEGSKTGFTRRSQTSATSLTRERVSAAPKAFSFSSSAASSPNRSSSDAAAAASASDFSTVADELFSSAEEVEGSNDGESGDGQRHRTKRTPVTSAATAAAAVVEASPISLMTSLEHSVSIAQPSLHSSQSSSAAPSSFRDTSRSAEPHQDEAGAEADEGEPSAPTQPSRGLQATVALADVWLGGFDVPGVRVDGSGATATHAVPTAVGAASNRGSAPSAPAPTISSSPDQQHLPLRQQRTPTTGARALAEQHSCSHEAQKHWQQTLQQRQDALLHRRCVRVRADTPVSPAESPPPITVAAGASATDDAVPQRTWVQCMGGGKVAPVMDHKAAAEHLRALCALLQTDLIVISALQELSALMRTTPVAVSADTEARNGKAAPQPSSPCSFFAAATRLLVSLQQHRKIQARSAQEAYMLHDGSNPATISSQSAHTLTSISDPLTPPGRRGVAMTGGDGTGAAPLMLSVLHPMSALGYIPMLRSVASTAVDRLLSGDSDGAGDTLSHEEHLTRYILAVAPYLLAWETGAAETGNCDGAPRQEVPHPHEPVSPVGGEGTLPLASALCAASPSRLPLPVWVYVESLTTTLLEEARKLNAMYELYVLLVAEATLQSRRSGAGCAADLSKATSTAFSLAPMWHGGTDETLMSYVRRRGRAASIAQGTGVLGMAVSLDNGLEKYVTPISAYLLNSFDQLEGRHLLHSVFQEVQLSDVVARVRARREHKMGSSPAGRRRSPGAPSADDEEGLDNFSLPPGTLSSPALRSAASAQPSMRATEQRTSSGRGGGSVENDVDQPAEQQRRGDSESETTRQRRGRGTARRLINLSGPGQTRHAIIEGFVRYLTGDRRRSGTLSGGANSPSHGTDQRSGTESGGSPSQQRASSHTASHHHSGLTLDVPHTSSLLQEMDARLEAGASNVALIRSVERMLDTGSLVDALNVGKLLPHKQAELSTRHYFNARAATFTTRHTLPSYTAACVSVVQCRWQPVFQSTMCFCPVTRRRCLDPLVCGALLICATLPPQEIICSAPDPSQSSTPTHGVSGGPAEVATGPATGTAAATNANRQLPNTIRALRSRFERSTESSRPAQQRQVQAPSPRSNLPQPESTALRQGRRAFLLRGPSMMPDAITISRIMTRAVTALYADSAVLASDRDEGREEEDQEGGATTATASAAAVTPLNNDAFHVLRAVTVPLDMPPVTRNLLASPDRAYASLLNPPTLLECGHVVSHKTYLDLRTTARRTNRNAAAVAAAGTTTVVCCPYCSKVTAVKDAVTLMPYGGFSKTRYGDSLEGWSAVDKVAKFSQAVGRVSGGRGTAILIALIDGKAQLIDTPSIGLLGNSGNNGSNLSHGLTHWHRSDGCRSTQRAQQPSNSGWCAGRPGASRSSTTPQSPPALGVLLTTSYVLRSPQDMADASVCFLDQPIVGMAALLGREPKPMHVGLCSAFGFVSSVATPKKEREYTCRTSTVATACRSRLDDEPDYLLYAAAAGDSEEDETVEIGFTLTYCEVFPTHDDATYPKERSPPLNPSQPGGSHGCSAESAMSSPSERGPSYEGGAGLGKEADGTAASLSEFSLPRERGAKGVASDAAHAAGGPQVNRLASDAARRRFSGAQDSLCQVQPLHVPLLLSAIPAIKVGDVHLMITHVNDGRRSYRVQRVAAVFADYCLYEPTSFGEVTCSGGPVFNMQGDFIGVQHERNGQSLCLLIKSIVRHLFDAGLLGMCRAPISAETIKQREVHARPGDAVFSAMTTRLPAFSGSNRMPPLKTNNCPTSLRRTGAAAASDGAERGGHSASSSRLPAVPLGSKSPATLRAERDFTVDATGTTMAPSLATMSNFGSPRTLHGRPADSTANSSCKSVRPAEGGAGVADAVAAAALPLIPPSKPLSQCVPSFEEVFAEFFDGADSLPHILYAFPYCPPLVKITMESLAQVKCEDELERIVAVGGVGAILEAIDGHPQEEQIVTSALAALCRICLCERNLAIFLHLDGVVTVMEIMKEYVRQQAVLQWGIRTLLCATDMSCPSAAASAELMVRSSAPELLVNVLRVHGAAPRKTATRQSQPNHLIRWDCDLIANLLMANPRLTTLFLREDFLTLLLQLSRDDADNAFLMEGFAHVFCAFVQCFTEEDEPPPPHILQVAPAPGFKRHPAMPSPNNSPAPRFRELSVHGGASNPNRAAHCSGGDHVCRGGRESPASSAPATSSLYSPNTIATSPHKVSFFFLCDIMSHDTDGRLARAVLDVCEAALDPKNSITAHRGRPEVVLMRCLETLRLLLTWGLLRLPRGEAMLSAVEGLTVLGFASTLAMPPTCFSAPSSPRSLPSFSQDTARLLLICQRVRRESTSSSELVVSAEAVQRLLLRGSRMSGVVCAGA